MILDKGIAFRICLKMLLCYVTFFFLSCFIRDSVVALEENFVSFILCSAGSIT